MQALLGSYRWDWKDLREAWADFDVYMPDRWARDMPRRRAAAIPGDL